MDDTMLLLDATDGKLFVSPDRKQLAAFNLGHMRTKSDGIRQKTGEAGEHTAPHQLMDGQRLFIYANVNLLADARNGLQNGADGIGLYRSEFPFIIRNDFVSEEEQYRVYRSVVRSMPDRPVVLRTADIGGDKLMAGREEERNPFLGVRGIRFSLANRDLFRIQLRAMLRAGAGADLGIMFPMVASVDEIEDARAEVMACIDALSRDGLDHNGSPRVGAMVELPSAVISIEEMAERTDFLSIGTNDLIMYLLAVDRTSERLSELYRSHHPAVLKTLAEIARRIGADLSHLSVCGESAADPLMVPFFLGIGITKLSVSPHNIGPVAAVAARYDRNSSEEFAARMLSIRSLKDMEQFLREYRPTA